MTKTATIKEVHLSGIEIIAAKTGARDVVTIMGSFLGGDIFNPRSARETSNLVALMLSEGTISRTKEEVANTLESLGASIEFASDAFYIRFTAKCLTRDMPKVLELLAEELKEPRFGAKEFEVVRRRYIGELKEAAGETGERAKALFANRLFPAGHPNHAYLFPDRIKFVERANIALLKKFHARFFGTGSLKMVAVGDIEMNEFENAVARSFSGWKKQTVTIPPIPRVYPLLKNEVLRVTMHDKASVDISFGNAITLTERHKDYYPLALGIATLGQPGSFRARLMNEIREKRGLSYFIYAYLRGALSGATGYFLVWGTFAPPLLPRGLASTEAVLTKWAVKGISEKELKIRKESLAGSYEVGLSTTSGLALTILSTREQGYPLSRIDEFPEIIKKITRAEVNKAIKKYVNPKRLLLVCAGSIDENGKPLS